MVLLVKLNEYDKSQSSGEIISILLTMSGTITDWLYNVVVIIIAGISAVMGRAIFPPGVLWSLRKLYANQHAIIRVNMFSFAGNARKSATAQRLDRTHNPTTNITKHT